MTKALNSFLTWNALNFVGQAVISLVAIPVYYHRLPAEDFAVLSLIWTAIAISSVMDLGLGRSLTRALATITNERAGEPYLVTASSGVVAAFLYSSAAAALTLILAPLYLERSFAAGSVGLALVGVIALMVFGTLFSNAFIAIFEGMHRIRTASMLRISAMVGLMGVPAVLLALHVIDGLSTVLWIALGGRLMQVAVSIAVAARMQVFMPRAASWVQIRDMFATGKWLTVSNVTGIIVAYSDRLIIGLYFTAPMLAAYAIASELIQRGTSLFAVVSNSVFPLISGTGKNESAHGHLKRTAAMMLVIGGGGFVVAQLLAKPLISLWLGTDDVTEIARIFSVMLWGWAVVGWAQLQLTKLHASGNMKHPALVHLAEVAVSVPVMILSIKFFGVLGAAVTWSVRAQADALLLTWLNARGRAAR